MMQTVEIFYSFQCPYCYLAIDELSNIANKFPGHVIWQPYSSKAAGRGFMQNNYNIPYEKVSYTIEDVTRLSKDMKRIVNFPESWPESEFDPDRSIRGALAAIDMGFPMEYNIKMFDRWWSECLDPNEQSFFIQLCDDLDVDPNEFSGRMSTADIRERVKGVYKRGRKLQVFETPTIVIGEERFVGIDRIATAEKRIKELDIMAVNS